MHSRCRCRGHHRACDWIHPRRSVTTLSVAHRSAHSYLPAGVCAWLPAPLLRVFYADVGANPNLVDGDDANTHAGRATLSAFLDSAALCARAENEGATPGTVESMAMTAQELLLQWHTSLEAEPKIVRSTHARTHPPTSTHRAVAQQPCTGSSRALAATVPAARSPLIHSAGHPPPPLTPASRFLSPMA